MTRLSNEMKAAATSCETLQDVVGKLLNARSTGDVAPMAELQKLDALTQTLWNLNSFISEIAAETEEHLSVDATNALAVVSLRDLALRLERPTPLSDTKSTPADETGAIDLFAEG